MDTRRLEEQAHEVALGDLDLEATCLAFDQLLRRSVDYHVAGRLPRGRMVDPGPALAPRRPGPSPYGGFLGA